MSICNILFSMYNRKSPYTVTNLQLLDFLSKVLKNEFATAINVLATEGLL